MACNKIGFLLLTERGLTHPGLWADFLQSHEHRFRFFTLSKRPDQLAGAWLCDTVIEEYVETMHSAHYPHTGLMVGQTALLRAGLADRECTKFVFVSETCVPIRRFEYVDGELTKDDRSWITHGPWPARYAMLPKPTPITPEQFGTSSNWIVVNRRHAEILVEMEPIWMKHFESVVAADEHYPPTMLALNGIDVARECHPRVATHVEWHRDAPYPGPYQYKALNEEDIRQLIRVPYLFARKFPASSDIARHLARIMAEGEIFQRRLQPRD